MQHDFGAAETATRITSASVMLYKNARWSCALIARLPAVSSSTEPALKTRKYSCTTCIKEPSGA
jgi:hypothetical protein